MAQLLTQNVVKSALAGSLDKDHVSDTQVPGLSLRIRKSKVNWTVRATLHDRSKRYDLGRAALEDDAGAICLKTARNRAYSVRAMCDAGYSPLKQINAWAIGTSLEKVETLEAEKPKPSWEWSDAIQKFVDWNLAFRRKDTADDYRQKLADTPEMAKFRGRQVNLITRNELMEAVGKINARGKWSTACGVRRVLSRFFNWMAMAERQNDTNVAENLMLNTTDPERPANEIGMNDHKRTSDYDDEEEHGDAPPPIELGRALAIARLGVLNPARPSGSCFCSAPCNAGGQSSRPPGGASSASQRSPAPNSSGPCRPSSGNQAPSAAARSIWCRVLAGSLSSLTVSIA
jgi:hypothetical protein